PSFMVSTEPSLSGTAPNGLRSRPNPCKGRVNVWRPPCTKVLHMVQFSLAERPAPAPSPFSMTHGCSLLPPAFNGLKSLDRHTQWREMARGSHTTQSGLAEFCTAATVPLVL